MGQMRVNRFSRVRMRRSSIFMDTNRKKINYKTQPVVKASYLKISEIFLHHSVAGEKVGLSSIQLNSCKLGN